MKIIYATMDFEEVKMLEGNIVNVTNYIFSCYLVNENSSL